MFGALAAAVNPVALLGTGAQIGGSILNYKAQQDTNATNQRIADNQNQFQQNQSETTYQRAVADMKKAGLNPSLAYQQGGNPSMSGTSASVQAPQLDLDKTVSSAMDALRLKKEIKAVDSQTMLNENAAAMQRSQMKLNETNAKAIREKMPAIKANAQLEKDRAEYDRGWIKFDSNVNRAGSTAGTIMKAVNPLQMLKNGFRPKKDPGTSHLKERRSHPAVNKKTGEIYDKRFR